MASLKCKKSYGRPGLALHTTGYFGNKSLQIISISLEADNQKLTNTYRENKQKKNIKTNHKSKKPVLVLKHSKIRLNLTIQH